MRILLLVALASPLLALWPKTQDPTAIDWRKEVERACTSPRYGLRLAAARKVASGGGAAVPAIRAFAQEKGVEQVPAALVEAMADDSGLDAAVLELLREWSLLPGFYWRAAAMRGLAQRAPRVAAGRDALRQLFADHHDDAAWLMRTHARFGTILLGDERPLQLPAADPRGGVRLSMLLLALGKPAPLQPLLDALADERTFQGDPWGQRMAGDAHKALKGWLGDAHPLANGGSFPDVETGLRALLAACQTRSGQELAMPAVRRDTATAVVGGIELLSCQHGDQFVQWTADGTVWLGIDAARSVTVPASTWDTLSRERTALPLTQNLGVVICDSMRLRWQGPDVHVKIAPATLPLPVVNWLKHLAVALEEAGESRLAATLRAGLEQFAAR